MTLVEIHPGALGYPDLSRALAGITTVGGARRAVYDRTLVRSIMQGANVTDSEEQIEQLFDPSIKGVPLLLVPMPTREVLLWQDDP